MPFSRRLFLQLLPIWPLTAAATAKAALQFGVVPQFPAEQIHRDWFPLLRQLSQQSGIELELKLFPNIPAFEQALFSGQLDIAYANPYHAVMAQKSEGYLPFLRDNSTQLTGILLTPNEGGISDLAQLQQKEIAFPAPNAFGASLLLRAWLSEKEKLRFTPRYVKTHSNVFRQVISKMVPAGGAIRQTLQREPAEIQAQLKILYETPGFPSHPLIHHPRVPPSQAQQLQQRLLQMAREANTQPMLAAAGLAKPVACSDGEYAPLQRLGLERYVVKDWD